MATQIDPVMFKIIETEHFLDTLETEIKETLGEKADLILDYPTVYMHVWIDSTDESGKTYNIYIGEANDVISRTKQHWNEARVIPVKEKWQQEMLKDRNCNNNPTLYIFGHQYFHKSLTMDIENKLLDFCFSIPFANTKNSKINPQGIYSGDDNFESIFGKIWRMLGKENSELFISETKIKNSAIFKSSPMHKLTDQQKKSKQFIIDNVVESVLENKENQLVMVEGEAGTGKTVLTSSTFYEILKNDLLGKYEFSAYLLVNHDEQLRIYEQTATKLGYPKEIVLNPTAFLNKYTDIVEIDGDPSVSSKKILKRNSVDVVFIDEAHLLWSQGKQAYTGENQLDDIMQVAKTTVIMFDEYQILRKEQYLEHDSILLKREIAKEQNNYMLLDDQLRMNCSSDTLSWIDNLTKRFKIESLHPDSKGYEVKIFETPESLHKAITKKTSNNEDALSRVVATYDWPYSNDRKAVNQNHWTVKIDNWELAWNREMYKDLNHNRRQRLRYKKFDWAEQPHSIDEVGSTFTVQGFDLSFVGIIIGPSVKYDEKNKLIYFVENLDKNEGFERYSKMIGNRTISNGKTVNVSKILSRNELRVLLTRGTKGLYIYAYDEDLRNALSQAVLKK